MSDELVKRLRACEYMAMPDNRIDWGTMDKAADRIEALTAKLAEVEAERDATLMREKDANAKAMQHLRRAEAAAARERDAYARGFKEALEEAENQMANCIEMSLQNLAEKDAYCYLNAQRTIRAIPLPTEIINPNREGTDK